MTEPRILALTARRKAANVTQEQAAAMAGISLKTYQRIEAGTSDMRLKHYGNLLRHLNVTDLDLALDMMDVGDTSIKEVTAAARLLPGKARVHFIEMVMAIYQDH